MGTGWGHEGTDVFISVSSLTSVHYCFPRTRTADQSWLLSDILINLTPKRSIFVISLHKKQTLKAFSSCFSDNNAASLEMHPTLWYAGIRITSQTANTSVLFLHSNGKMKSCFKLNCEWSRLEQTCSWSLWNNCEFYVFWFQRSLIYLNKNS